MGRRVALVAGIMCFSLGAVAFGHTGTAHAATACPLPFNGVASVTSLPVGDKFISGLTTVTLTGNPGLSVAFKPQASGVINVNQSGHLVCGTVPILGIGPTAGTVSGSMTLNTGAVCSWDGVTLTYLVSDAKGHDQLSFSVNCFSGAPPTEVLIDIGIGATGSSATPEAGSAELLGTGLVVLGGSLLLSRRRRRARRA